MSGSSHPAFIRFRRACAGAVLLPLVAAAQEFDHSAFDQLLRAHVANGMVDYDAFGRAPEFRRYLTALAAADPARLPRATCGRYCKRNRRSRVPAPSSGAVRPESQGRGDI